MSLKSLLVVLAACPTFLAAQESVFSPEASSSCLEGEGTSACIGLSADQCMEESPGGYSTVGMNDCLEQERAWWDAELSDIYAIALSTARDTDAQSEDPDQPSWEEALREMQRAWITYRDATCNYEVLSWYGGTGASAAWLGCQMHLTGEQTLFLRRMAYGG
jgi:uncharacterized protein YecT (DUF1311 family)